MGSNTSKKKSKRSETKTSDLGKYEALIKEAKKTSDFASVCNALNLSPAACQKLIEEAVAKGIKIRVKNNHVGMENTQHASYVSRVEILPTKEIAPVVGNRRKVAVISDLHLGSMYCLREQIKDFVEYAYSEGVRTILIPGDVLEGCYKHAEHELDFVGIEDQTKDLFNTLPQLPGLRYDGITGNHDWTFTNKVGVGVGEYIEGYFLKRGRGDVHFWGDRGAFLEVEGAVIHLWHPGGRPGYAKSHKLQRVCEQYTAIKPQILLAGHWHFYAHVEERGIHAIACPTFHGGMSPFGKSLGGSPAIGGLILSWDQTAHRTIRNFQILKRTYFEVEEPIKIHNHMDAIPVPGAIRGKP